MRNLLLLSVLALLALPAGAQASPLSDCRGDNDLDRTYTKDQLRKALDNLPSDVEEYSNCREVIGAAMRSAKEPGGGGGGAGGSDSGSTGGTGGGVVDSSPDQEGLTEQENRDLEAATGNAETDPPSVEVGGKDVTPGDNGLYDLASTSNDLPMPLVLALVALGLLALVGGLVALRGRVPALTRIPVLSKIPVPRVRLPRFRR